MNFSVVVVGGEIITDRNRWAVVKSYKATSGESRDVREGRFASVPFVGFTENSCGSGWWRRWAKPRIENTKWRNPLGNPLGLLTIC